MKNRRTYIAGIAVLFCSIISLAHAEDTISNEGFGNSTLTQVTPVQKKSGECISFEASFSEPLNREPSAVLDIEKNFTNLLNAFLEVTKISDKKYRMALTASTADGCPKVTDGTELTISTYSGQDTGDSRQTMPDSKTFQSQKNQLKAVK